MDDADLEAIIEAGARLLRIPLRPEWLIGVRLHLATNLRLAQLVTEFDLPDDLDPAYVFGA
jgi:Protein of unknown function (DUF4089)